MLKRETKSLSNPIFKVSNDESVSSFQILLTDADIYLANEDEARKG